MEEDISYFSLTMQKWFSECGRDLVWRHNPTPYQVWVSEIMLQQTQVVTVIPYYERWMARFPTVQALAEADLQEVLQLWAGLGYYRRAGYLHKGAQVICRDHQGEFPQEISQLRKIPGIGAYTAGAIASFAFGKNEPAIDGNIERVLSRFLGISGDLTSGDGRRSLEKAARKLADLGNAGATSQAMMDLGASCCGKSAHCEQCPVSERCFALRHGLTESLPEKKQRIEKYDEYRAAAWISCGDDRFLIARRRPNLLLGGLWEIPMLEISRGKGARKQAESAARLPRLRPWTDWLNAHHCSQSSDCNILWMHTGNCIQHTFTHIQMRVYVDKITTSAHIPEVLDSDPYDTYIFASIDEIGQKYPISSLMTKILKAGFKD